ncbi:MAG TPA: hypothetical protein VMP03_08210 [Methylomirabilota bacterium]|nr:hypothetical protein [Methylomirabilota bacterium]
MALTTEAAFRPSLSVRMLLRAAVVAAAGSAAAAVALAVTVALWTRCFAALDVFTVVVAGLNIG